MPRRVFNRELLDDILTRDGATLVGEYEKINRETRITFRCKCGTQYEKGCRYIIEEAGALCKECGKKHMVEVQRSSMMAIYGVSHPMHLVKFKKKQETTMVAKYGVTHNSLNPETIRKRKETLLEHFGVEHHFKLPEKIEERKYTYLKKFGKEHHLQVSSILEKQKKTNRKKRGVDYSLQSKEVRDKGIATNIAKYGVEYPSQSPEIMEKIQKNAKKFKDFKFPSGIIRKVQGYEHFALQELLKAGYTEDQIKTERKEVPRITYTVNEKNRYYFPDIFLPHENKIIEVKSTWTYKCKTDNIELKKEASIMAGYLYEIWCYDSKGNRVDVTTLTATEPSLLTDASADVITHV